MLAALLLGCALAGTVGPEPLAEGVIVGVDAILLAAGLLSLPWPSAGRTVGRALLTWLGPTHHVCLAGIGVLEVAHSASFVASAAGLLLIGAAASLFGLHVVHSSRDGPLQAEAPTPLPPADSPGT
ncbi:MAG: hypothetical protein ACXVKN_15015, partial [Acidimicrobiia bacterium]